MTQSTELVRTELFNLRKKSKVNIAVFFFISILFSIPCHIVWQSKLRTQENKLIKVIQANFDNKNFDVMIELTMALASSQLNVLILLILAIFSETRKIYQVTFLYLIGIYCIMILKLSFEAPRPFWQDD